MPDGNTPTAKARPILFSAPMIRALLDGRKTQTRRGLAKQPEGHHWSTLPPAAEYRAEWRNPYDRRWLYQHRIKQNREWETTADVVCPYGKPGDLLWVRESWAQGWTYMGERPCTFYAATGDGFEGGAQFPRSWDPQRGASAPSALKWKPSIHMPRWASRLTLRITDVRVQRLQDISEVDAAMEGAAPSIVGADLDHMRYRCGFQTLWESINGPGSWGANPWVWAISFEVIRSNVDEVLKS